MYYSVGNKTAIPSKEMALVYGMNYARKHKLKVVEVSRESRSGATYYAVGEIRDWMGEWVYINYETGSTRPISKAGILGKARW